MINFINEAELMSVYSIKEQSEICDKLSSVGIDYKIKVINRKSPSPFTSGLRANTGSFGEIENTMNQYIIYVNKKDIEKAKQVIRK